jgi:hypothetical protein
MTGLLLIAALQQIQGTVRSAETNDPLGYSIVRLIPQFGQRFTDAVGRFSFDHIPAGTYLLSVRQIGYTPIDTQLVISASSTIRLSLTLRHLAVELPAITITGHAQCTQPGPPDRDATPALAAVFDQLLENARRLELLADSYPFRTRVERALQGVSRRGDSLTLEVDTLDLGSHETQRPYRPGQVVTEGTGPYRGRIVSLPALQELGDSAFLWNHCFRLAGRDTIEGQTLVRIDFEPHERMRFSDVAGSAYLDSTTYQLIFTDTDLTRPDRAGIRGIRDLTARVRFRAITTGIVLPQYVRAVTRYRVGELRSRVETQWLLAVYFTRKPPP